MILVLALAVLVVGVVVLSGAYLPKKYLAPWNKAYSNQFQDIRVKVASHGILAASAHNMQPWRATLDQQDQMSFWLFVDPEGLTPEVDPYARQIVITQGTFLEYMRIAGEQLGYRTSIVLFPNGEFDQDASTASLKAKPVAKVTLQHAEPKPSSLYDDMFTPDTSRVAYQETKLTEDQIRQLRDLNTFEGIVLEFFQDEANLDRLHQFAEAGTRIENDVPGIAALSSKIFRPNEYQKNKYRYGFSLEGGGMSGPMMYLLEALLTALPSMNSPEAAKNTAIDQTRLAIANTPAYALIITRDNSRSAQVDAGLLYSRFQLAAATMGFAMQPMSQVLEEFPQMREQYEAVHKAYAPQGGTIQMLIRVGKPVKQVPRSMRRDVREIIEDGPVQ
ncbi:MAG: Acg family FMN-binding oxidoreductase [Gammaproteobacteria bacterium]